MLSPYIDSFILYCTNLKYAKNSIKELNRYAHEFNDFINRQDFESPAFRENILSRIKYNHLLSYLTEQPPGILPVNSFENSSSRSPTSIKARIWMLKKFFQFLMLKGYVKNNIASILNQPKIPKKETRFLTGEELKIIFIELHKRINDRNGMRDFLIIMLMSTLGLRKSSICSLDVEDVDFEFGRIFILEKGNTQKRILLAPMAVLKILQEYIESNALKNGALFAGRKNDRMPGDNVNKIVSKLKNTLLKEGHGFASDLYPHIFRHAAATQLNEYGGIEIARDILGHRRIKSTFRYIHLSPTVFSAYMKRHPFFNNGVNNEQ